MLLVTVIIMMMKIVHYDNDDYDINDDDIDDVRILSSVSWLWGSE